MPIFRTSDPAYFEGMTTNGMEWSRQAAKALGYDLGAVVMGEDATDPVAPVAMIVWQPPGAVTVRHAHDCYRIDLVLQGSRETEGVVLRPGDVEVSGPMEFYGPSVAGPEGCLSAEIFSAASGVASVVAQDADPEGLAAMERLKAAIVEAKQSMGVASE